MWGGPGHDRMAGRRDEDRLAGRRGNDILDGGEQDDVVFGDNGHDTCRSPIRESEGARDCEALLPKRLRGIGFFPPWPPPAPSLGT